MSAYEDYIEIAHDLIANGTNDDDILTFLMESYPLEDYKYLCTAIWDAREHFE